MPLTMHEQQYGVDVEPMATRPPFALGVYFGPNRIMAAAALNLDGYEANVAEGSEFRTKVDGLRVVASIEGSVEYRSVYQWVRVHCVKFTLAEEESPRDADILSLIEDVNSLPVELMAGFNPPNDPWSLSTYQQIQSIFDQQLQQIKQRAEHNLGQSIGISAISLPYYWNEQLKDAVQQAASHPHMMVGHDMLLCHELTTRLAYNLGNSREGAWFFVAVEYNTLDLYLTFAMIIDPNHPREDPRYSVYGQYLLQNLGEASLTRAGSHLVHEANIKKAIDQFVLKHVSKDLDSKIPYSYIRGIILTGDASDDGMRTMKRILREVFVDLPQCASGNIFTSLRPSHVVALGAARAVRTHWLKENLSRDVCATVDIED